MGVGSDEFLRGYVMIQSVVCDGIHVYSYDHGSSHLISRSKMFLYVKEDKEHGMENIATLMGEQTAMVIVMGDSFNIFVQLREWDSLLQTIHTA